MTAGAATVVVEARDRVGGRGAERGARRWQGRGGRRAVDRPHPGAARSGGRGARRAHVSHVRPRRERDRARRKPARYRGTIPRLNPLVLLDVERAQRKLNRMARGVPLAAPWEASRAARLDREPLPADAAQPRHQAGRELLELDRGGVGGRARGPLAAPSALLRALRGQPRDAVRRRGRRPAGPIRRRLPARAAENGRAARRRAWCSAHPFDRSSTGATG